MNTQRIFIRAEKSIKAPNDYFHWIRNEEQVTAEATIFSLNQNRTLWSIAGFLGSYAEETSFSLLLAVPYINNEILERTYVLGDGQGLHCVHQYWLPPVPGFSVIGSDQANYAELSIRLDPKAGTVTGDFNAIFKSRRVDIHGSFKLTQNE
ncbi:hypothetical protein [Pseudomonas fluorescens]|uniref:hypothetical protein n=1 Tax=Pseudomonas fluorescens TaxID=294 RepID=UPI00069B3A42|nr:hypothetical protein [Pseudomonas fluorescens]